MLRDTLIKKNYRSDRDDIGAFVDTALQNSISYDRAAGYFTSGMLTFVVTGLKALIRSKGRMRLIASPELSYDDIVAIQKGYADRQVLALRSIEHEVDRFLASENREATEMLSTLIELQLLDIRIATPESGGIFHEKMGIFRDSSDAVAFSGSLNETAAAFGINFEAIDVYTSWDDPERVIQKQDDFGRLWRNETPKITTFEFPAFLKGKIVSAAASNRSAEASRSRLRAYQRRAIDAWRSAGGRGILSMATGSGKTITALEAANETLSDNVKVISILAPLKHIAEQWASAVIERMQLSPIICHSENDWRSEIQLARARQLTDHQSPIVLIATYATAQTNDFSVAVTRLAGRKLLIADEVHNITPDNASLVMLPLYDLRLGLSATPERHLDEEGTKAILDFFSGIVFEYTLREAIEGGTLTPYFYRPILCMLTNSEQLEYDKLMRDLHAQATDQKHNILLYSKRNSLLERALDKIQKFQGVFNQAEVALFGHALIYCHPDLLDVVMGFVGHAAGVRAHRFTAHESLAERKDILSRFVAGDLKALVAIRCLDEGVDVPSVRTAFLLNSSSNPKEFIQRRGRVLRLAPDKPDATIYDFVVLPQRSSAEDEKLLKKELRRFYEFAQLAINKDEAMAELRTFSSTIDLTIDWTEVTRG